MKLVSAQQTTAAVIFSKLRTSLLLPLGEKKKFKASRSSERAAVQTLRRDLSLLSHPCLTYLNLTCIKIEAFRYTEMFICTMSHGVPLDV